MKKSINQFVVSKSQRFLNNVSNLLPEKVENFEIFSFSMGRASGYGSYNYLLDVEINGESITLKKHSHNSVDYDYYTDLEYQSHNYNNWVKRGILSMLSDFSISDQIYQIAIKYNE